MRVEPGAHGGGPTCPSCRGEEPRSIARGAGTSTASSAALAVKPMAKPLSQPATVAPVVPETPEPTPEIGRAEPNPRAFRVSALYGLPMPLAVLVAENKITLAEALEEKTGEPEHVEGRIFWIGWTAAFAGGLAVLVGAAIWSAKGGFDSGPLSRAGVAHVQSAVPVPTVQSSVEVQANPEGRATGIRALDPELVLSAYCQTFPKIAQPVPVRVAPTAQEGRLGIFKVGENLHAIEIRKVAGSAYWAAGNGKDPIEWVGPGGR